MVRSAQVQGRAKAGVQRQACNSVPAQLLRRFAAVPDRSSTGCADLIEMSASMGNIQRLKPGDGEFRSVAEVKLGSPGRTSRC
jgi:hypothetical protein